MWLLVPVGVSAQTTVRAPRIVQLFNFDWKFQAGNQENAFEKDYDDTSWRTLDLPHDFQIEQPWVESAGGARGFKAMGKGWYRKTFQADSSWRGRRVLLAFEGIMLLGDVWVNGQWAGSTDYGYLGMEVDITSLLDFEGDNVVAVCASTGKKGGSRWYTGGGLYRNVHLLVKDSTSIARHGVFITTPKVCSQSAEVCIQVEVEGLRYKRGDVGIEARIFAPDGALAAETGVSAVTRTKLKNIEMPLPVAEVAAPQLWSCAAPNLYTAEVRLVHRGEVIDSVTETFGIRTVEYSPEFGFRLNGEKIFLQGIANHQDMGAVGAAAFERAIERQFQQMKDFGFNHVRCAHNPYSESFYALADKYGILVVDELIDKWSDGSYWGGRKPFMQLWPELITEWVKRDRNHPSVILWSLGNELQMREDLAGYPTGDWGVTTYRIFDTMLKRYDPTRKTTVAMYPARAGAISRKDRGFKDNFAPPELSLVTEIASYNYQFEAYPKYLEHKPDLIVYQSEATSNELLAPYFGMDRDRMVGLAYWGAIEYWGESNGWPKKGWNYSFFSHALQPYPQAYLIKSAFSEEPVVRIGVIDEAAENVDWNDVTVGGMRLSSHWNRSAGSVQQLFTFTNADEVELWVDGKSMGVRKNDRSDIRKRNMIYWKDVPYGKGGKIVAVARTGGKEVARHELLTAGEASAILLAAEDPADWPADGMVLRYIGIFAVDRKGNAVPTAGGRITVEVGGAARLVALDNDDHYTDKTFAGNTIELHNGFALAVLRAAREAGDVRIRVSGEGMKSAVLKLKTRSRAE